LGATTIVYHILTGGQILEIQSDDKWSESEKDQCTDLKRFQEMEKSIPRTYKKERNPNVVHFNSLLGFISILADKLLRGFANMREKYEGVLGSIAGQPFRCIWFNGNTKGSLSGIVRTIHDTQTIGSPYGKD